MGSAQLDFIPAEETQAAAVVQTVGQMGVQSGPSALRQQVAERLAAHKQRRERLGVAEAAAQTASQAAGKAKAPKHRVAATVAERYAQTPSYRAFLAEQAKRAVEEAAAAAEIAMRNAEAVAAAQQELLGELELWNAPQEFTPETATVVHPAPVQPAPVRPKPQERSAGLTVRLYEDLRQVPAPPPVATPVRSTARAGDVDPEEAIALDAEIAFRQSPVWSPVWESFRDEFWANDDPLEPLPANLLEFPRQLVAPRKARPRLAEGPLREEFTPRTAQLRIFEVEPEQISSAPPVAPAAPEWTSTIRLDAHAVTAPAMETETTPLLASLLPPQTASLGLRVMAALVDGILVAGAALAVVAMFARLAGEIPFGLPLALSALGLLVALHVVYQMLFFTLSDQTPGMRYARIGFCTFSDENPTRAQMRRRIWAQFVAVVPAGLGLLWIFLDDDGLGWHDRISRMYQRAY
jgi:uncharacterized RDD family membrane protein YckC